MSASRPVPSTAANAAFAFSASPAVMRRAAVACTVIADSACATTSCSSLAIRVRSSAAAASASSARSASARCAFSRSAWLSRERLRRSWPNNIGAAIANVTEKTNDAGSFSYSSVRTAPTTNAAPSRNAAASRTPSVCAPTENATKMTTKNGEITLSVTSGPSRSPNRKPSVADPMATRGSRRRSAMPTPNVEASASPAASLEPASGVNATSSKQISTYTTRPSRASNRYGGSARRRAIRLRSRAMRHEW